MPALSLPFSNTPYTRRELVAMVLLFLSYLASAQLAQFLFIPPAIIQPAAGVALAFLILGGVKLWPAILVAALTLFLSNEAPVLVALSLALAHTLHGVAAAVALKYFRFDPVFRRVRDTLIFILVAFASAMIVPTIGFAGLFVNNVLFGTALPQTTWWAWWAGYMIGDLILAAALIRWFAKPYFVRERIEWIELSIATLALSVTTYATFWTQAPETTNGIILIAWLIPFIWFSLRLGNRFTFAAFALATGISLTGVLYAGVPSESTIGQRIMVSEIFLATLAVIFYLFTAVVEERRRAARELKKQLHRTEELLRETQRQDRAKSDFIAVFAHELRNPLAPIVTSTEILKFRWGAHPEIAPLIDTIEDRTRAIVRLLDDLLDVSRISRQVFKLQITTLDLREIVQKVVAAMSPLATRSGLALSLTLPAKAVYVKADPLRLEQIIGNLVMNAIKYTEKGTITVTVRADEYAELSVRDTGIGISGEMLKRIFVPFSGLGVEHRHKHIKEGLGIGLWLTENLVKLHEGSIEATSDGVGHGSEFTVRFPITSSAIITNEIESMQPLNQESKLRVLVVDDNTAAAQGLGTLLSHVGNTVELAFSGTEAIETVPSFKPDVIILDIGLPDMSGYTVAERLRENGYHGRVIALTGYGQEEDKQKAAEAGFDHHLTKPVGLADIQAVLMPSGA